MRNITRAQEPFAVGDRVTCNGNPEGIITAIVNYSGSIMYEVRLWSGSRVVGNVCVSEHDITRNDHKEAFKTKAQIDYRSKLIADIVDSIDSGCTLLPFQLDELIKVFTKCNTETLEKIANELTK